jgi:hypothetical protein
MDDFKSFVYQKQEDFPLGITAKCVVHFRPKKDWKGQGYGFDWMRLGDTGDFGDIQPYIDIVSKQYVSTAPNANLEMDKNECGGDFRPNRILYNSLSTEYHPYLNISMLKQYFCSWLSLFPATVKKAPLTPLLPSASKEEPSGYTNTEADLRLYLDIKEAPDYLEFEDNEHFEITPKKISDDLGVGKRFWKTGNSTVKIKCKNEFNVDQEINIFAVKKDTVTGKDVKKLA